MENFDLWPRYNNFMRSFWRVMTLKIEKIIYHKFCKRRLTLSALQGTQRRTLGKTTRDSSFGV